MKRLSLAAGLIGLLLASLTSQVEAASITWNTPFNLTGAAGDVVTTGTLVDSAAVIASNLTVNGTLFHSVIGGSPASAIAFSGSSILALNFDGYAPTSTPWGTLAPLYDGWAYRDLRGGAPAPTLQLNGLSVGQSYLVQIFEPMWNHNWMTQFSDGVNVSSPVNVGGSGPSPQSITGTFIADSNVQNIFLTAPSAPNACGFSNCDYAFFEAVQVRSLSDAAPTPEPASLMLMGTGLGFVAQRLRRRRQTAETSNS